MKFQYKMALLYTGLIVLTVLTYTFGLSRIPEQTLPTRPESFSEPVIHTPEPLTQEPASSESIQSMQPEKETKPAIPKEQVLPEQDIMTRPSVPAPLTREPVVTYEEFTQTESIPFQVVTQEDPAAEVGSYRVLQEGVDGLITIITRIQYVDGEEKGRTVIHKEITRPAVEQIILEGSKPTGEQIVTNEEISTKNVGYRTIVKNDPDMPANKRIVLQEGQKGLITTITTITYANGIEISRDVREVVQEPVDEIIRVGTRPVKLKPVDPLGNSGKLFMMDYKAVEWAREALTLPEYKKYSEFSVIPVKMDDGSTQYSVHFK